MITPLGFYVVATLFCTNPNSKYPFKEWFQEQKNAVTLAQILGDDKWFEDIRGIKCIWKNVQVIKEKRKENE